MTAVWWPQACTGYLWRSTIDGLEWRRHDALCKVGYWRVSVTGWSLSCNAVMDDFGNLVRVSK